MMPELIVRVPHDDFLRALNQTYAEFVTQRLAKACGGDLPTIVFWEASENYVPKSQLWISRLLQDQWKDSGLRFQNIWSNNARFSGKWTVLSDTSTLRALRAHPENYWVVYADDLTVTGAQPVDEFMPILISRFRQLLEGTERRAQESVSLAFIVAMATKDGLDYVDRQKYGAVFQKFEVYHSNLPMEEVRAHIARLGTHKSDDFEKATGEPFASAYERVYGPNQVYSLYASHRVHDGLLPLPEVAARAMIRKDFKDYVNPVNPDEFDISRSTRKALLKEYSGDTLIRILTRDSRMPPYSDPQRVRGWLPTSGGTVLSEDLHELRQ